jgi:hypothetical protein
MADLEDLLPYDRHVLSALCSPDTPQKRAGRQLGDGNVFILPPFSPMQMTKLQTVVCDFVRSAPVRESGNHFRPLLRLLLRYNGPQYAAVAINLMCEGRHTATAMRLWDIYCDDMLDVAASMLADKSERLQAIRLICEECPVKDAPAELKQQAVAIVKKAMTWIFGSIVVPEEIDPVKETLQLLAEAGLFDTTAEIVTSMNGSISIGSLNFCSYLSQLVDAAKEVQRDMAASSLDGPEPPPKRVRPE